MHTRSTEYLRSGNLSPEVFIQDYDYSNSELLYRLDRVYEYQDYTITKFEHRIDLISQDIYSDERFSWILLYINRITIDELVRGKVLKFIDKDTLLDIISSI